MKEIFEAVTPDLTVEDVKEVKVRKIYDLTKSELDFISALMPSFQLEPEMFRLELIDNEIASLQDEVNSLIKTISLKLDLRAKVEEEAKKVKLK